MLIYVHRKYLKDTYSIGKLYINGEYFCDTLEDKDRGLSDALSTSTNKKRKVYGETAIPTGSYEVDLYYWAKYRKEYPHLKDVKAFEGILIHGGSNENHTLGCILVGKNSAVGRLTDNGACRKLTAMVKQALESGEKVTCVVSHDEIKSQHEV